MVPLAWKAFPHPHDSYLVPTLLDVTFSEESSPFSCMAFQEFTPPSCLGWLHLTLPTTSTQQGTCVHTLDERVLKDACGSPLSASLNLIVLRLGNRGLAVTSARKLELQKPRLLPLLRRTSFSSWFSWMSCTSRRSSSFSCASRWISCRRPS